MACVILIHANNRAEKIEILSNFNDNLNYEVTTDLKKYVAQRYKVRIVEEEEDGGGDSTQMAAVVSVENKDIPLLTAMVRNDQMDTTDGNVSTNRNTIVPEEEGYGTFIPYRDRMIEPKKEIDVAVDVLAGNDIPIINLTETDQLIANMEEDLHTDDIAIDVPCLENVVEMEKDVTEDDTVDNGFGDSKNNITNVSRIDVGPSTSTVTRSGRVLKKTTVENIIGVSSKKTTKMSSDCNEASESAVRRSCRGSKRPAYSIDDEDGEDDGPVSRKVSLTAREQTRKEKEEYKKGIECKKCLRQLSADYRRYSNAKDHAIKHTALIRYECPVDRCGFKCGPRRSFISHIRQKHGLSLSARNIDLTTEQEEELDQMTKECFPEFGTKNEYKVCSLCQTAVSNNSLDQHHPKQHSLHHIEFMLYKCNQSKCLFETKWYRNMVRHGKKKHGIENMSKEETGIKLTDVQKKEIDDMIERCFPNEDVDE